MVTNYTGTTHLILDVVGYFSEAAPAPTTTSSSTTSPTTSSTTTTIAPAVPNAPSRLEGVAGTRTVDLVWQKPLPGPAITGYRVTVVSGACGPCTNLQVNDENITQTTVGGLQPGTDYVFRVVAFNAQGVSSASNDLGIRTNTAAPDRPTGVAAIAGEAEATISWDRPNANGSPIIGYQVRLFPDVFVDVAGAATTTVTVSNLRNDFTYAVSVVAIDQDGHRSEPSTPAVEVTPQAVLMLRVMTWNLKRGLIESGEFREADMTKFRDRIVLMNADVVGFQEIQGQQATRLAQLLGWPTPHFVRTADDCPLWIQTCVEWGNAILSRYPITAKASWTLPRSSGETEDRKLLRATIPLPSGLRFDIYDTHLASKPDDDEGGAAQREIQARAVLARIAEDEATVQGTFRPVLVCDCNADPAYPEKNPPLPNPDPAIAALLERFVDAWPLVRPESPGYTSIPEDSGQPLSRRIDFVFVGRNSGVTIEDAQIDTIFTLSDHLSVTVQL